MDLLSQLSSQCGDRTAEADKAVAAKCLAEPRLLADIAAGLTSPDANLLADCAEVMTEVALEKPQLVAPYAAALVPLLPHKTTRVRWEATHALALIAHLRPDVIAGILPILARAIEDDKSIIVRDYSVDAVGNYAQTGSVKMRQVYPILKRSTQVWAGRHVGHALMGLKHVAANTPELRGEIVALAQKYVEDKRGVVRKTANRLVKEFRKKVG
jgi:hypothetical protein